MALPRSNASFLESGFGIFPRKRYLIVTFSINPLGDTVKREKPSFLIILVISSIFIFSSAYNDYQEFIADHTSSGMRYEDLNTEDFSLDKRQLNFTIGSSLLSIFPPHGNKLHQSPTDLALQIPSLSQKSSTLRC